MNLENNSIFVSAYITGINNYRKISEYIEYGRKMLDLDINQVIFIEKDIFDEHIKNYIVSEVTNNFFTYCIEGSNKTFNYTSYKNKIFVFFNRSDIYLYKYKSDVTDFHVETNNHSKDTIDYMFVQCHKTEWVKMAIILTKQNSNKAIDNFNFLWIDYGIYHMIRNEDVFKNELEALVTRNNSNQKGCNSIRIAGCRDLTLVYDNRNMYKNIIWYFAGSVFGGNETALFEFADKMKEKCIQIIKNKQSLMWEINVWYLIYLENREMFNSYMCNHDVTIISNY
jgi:hypothetical protein